MNNFIIKLLLPVIGACLCNVSANTLCKLHLMNNPINIKDINSFFLLIISPKIITGVIFYLLSMMIFFYLLSNFDLSIIIPLTALTYIFNFISAYVIFNENISLNVMIGTLIIIIGIIIISQTPSVVQK